VTLQRNAGYSLVELMVSLVLGLVIMAAVLSVYVGMGQSVRTEDALSRVQENARFALEKLSVDVRQAGFMGCVKDVNVLLNPAGVGYSAALYDLSRAVSGWEYAGTEPAGTFSSASLVPTGVSVSNWNDAAGADLDAQFRDLVVPGSDVLVIRRADQKLNVTATGVTPVNANTINLTSASGVAQDTIVLVSDCRGSDLFQNRSNEAAHNLTRGATGSPGNLNPATNEFSHAYDSDIEIYTFWVAAYYVGRGASGEPALFRRRYLTGGVGVAEELVDGVETMQVLYGEDTDTDRIADVYRTADTVADWGRIVSVRIGLLLRGRDEGRGEPDTASYALGGMTFDPIDSRNLRRRVATWTITLRNRVP
jgi:type IV pilus assembly protein PilW